VKIAVIAAGYDDPWRESHLVARRISGAFACSADVDLLVPAGVRSGEEHDGAVRVLLFQSTPFEPHRRRAWRAVAFGEEESTELQSRRSRTPDLPEFAEAELLAAEGGDSPDLYSHIRSTPYDVVVIVGYHSPVAYWALRALPDERRVLLAPASRDDNTLWLRIHDELFERAERFLVVTDSERVWLTERIGSEQPNRIENIGFVVGVNSLGHKTEPPGFDDKSYVILADNWYRARGVTRFQRWAEYLEEAVDPDLRLRFVGPGADRIRFGLGRTSGRLDIWRWVSRAVALLDPYPNRVIGREVLEAYNYGTPVIVNASGGANREHAEDGNGGLWYRTDDELFASVKALLDREVRSVFGQQGRAYAEEVFGDPDTYIKRLQSLLV
jgi:glycosyltransferase involved in cell wall biosynthesis